jgi:putative phosphoribosyl transferase
VTDGGIVKTDHEATDVSIASDHTVLEAILAIPPRAQSIVAFAHGSGSSRFSRRNQAVAKVLNDAGLATLLLDLLSAHEHADDAWSAQYRFDIPLLAERVIGAIDWLGSQAPTAAMDIGLFGASTGAAAALCAAAARSGCVHAVVSRGGRPDLADSALEHVVAPTLLIVGGLDEEVITLNEAAARRMTCEHRIEIVRGATHLFEEPGALEDVARMATDWFTTHLGRPRA